MDTLEKKLEALRTLRLSSEERARMRTELTARVGIRGVVSSHIPSPYLGMRMHVHMRTLVVATLALFLIIGTTASAAEGALPGSPLYGIKVGITEPLRTRLAQTPEAAASWSIEIANRRLQEAEELAAQNNLSSQSAEELATRIDTTVADVQTTDDALRLSGNTSASESIRAQLDGTIAAHQNLLQKLEVIRPKVKDSILALRDRIAVHGGDSEQIGDDTVSRVAVAAAPALMTASKQAPVENAPSVIHIEDHTASTREATTTGSEESDVILIQNHADEVLGIVNEADKTVSDFADRAGTEITKEAHDRTLEARASLSRATSTTSGVEEQQQLIQSAARKAHEAIVLMKAGKNISRAEHSRDQEDKDAQKDSGDGY